MTTQSNLKSQYPLSPKKFTKKMIEKAIIFIFLSIFLGVIAYFVTFAVKGGDIDNIAFSSTSTKTALITFFGSYIILLALYGWYIKYYIKTYFYEDEQDFLTIRKGVIMPAQIHVQYGKIQDVYVDQDLLDRILGIYDVHISSATYSSGIEAHIDGVDKAGAEGLKNLLLHKINKGSGRPSQSTQSAEMSSNQPAETSTTAPTQTHTEAHFAKPISSEVYGLGDNWWTGEIVKVAIGAVLIPAAFTAWLLFRGDGATNWKFGFWVWSAAFVVYVLFRAITLLLWKSHYKYNFGPEYIYMKIGVISVSEKNMGYNSVQDVQVRQGIVDRIFGVADLVIENAAAANMPVNSRNRRAQDLSTGITVEGLSLKDAREIAEELKKIISNKKDSSKGL